MAPRSRNRHGFTLGEVLVTVAIVAVLAAVVIPAIGSQITRGDLGRVTSDLLSIRGASEQFVADVRRYPNSIGQLITKPTVSVGPLMANASCPSTFTTTFSVPEVGRWRGPYLNKDSAAAVSTGYAKTIRSCFSTLTVGTSGTVDATGIKYMVVLIPGIDTVTANSLDASMDDGILTTGMLRLGSGDTLKFLAMPIQP